MALDLPAGDLAASLARLAAAAGVSIGLSGQLPAAHTSALSGRMTAARALEHLLAGTGLRAVPVGDAAFRIEPLPERPGAPAPARPLPPLGSGADLVVTGQKRPQALSALAVAIAVAHPDRWAPALAAGAQAVGRTVDGLAVTNLGPGRNRLFVRGAADSPFNGPSQSTVAIAMDETRLTFDAPDPDLRLVDIERVELLKGPQGPLYGSGALGGIYRLVTRKPDLAAASGSVRGIGEALAHGGPGLGIEAVANLPLAPDRLGLRLVGYGVGTGGWIDNQGRNADANTARTLGGRVAARWRAGPDWSADISLAAQSIEVDDSQYLVAPGGSMMRDRPGFAEPSDSQFRLAAATVHGAIGNFNVLAAAGFVHQTIGYTLDATPAAAAFAISGPALYRDDADHSLLTGEVRLWPEDGRFVAGLAYLHAESSDTATVAPLAGSTGLTQSVGRPDRTVSEYAAFAEATRTVVPHLDVTIGVRLSHTHTTNEAEGAPAATSLTIGHTALSPSAALSWQPDADSLVFLRYARSTRPGGLALGQSQSTRPFTSDELWTLDLGFRRTAGTGRLAFSADLYHTRWSHIQSDYLLDNGLISTRNVGTGRIVGGEASIEWRPAAPWLLVAGLGAIDAHLIQTEDGVHLEDRRLPVVPDIVARAGAERAVALGPWRGTARIDAHLVGRARLSFDPALDRSMGGYTTIGASLRLRRANWSIDLAADNLLDDRGDSFAFGNPFAILAQAQRTPVRPRSLTIAIGRDW